MYRGVCVFFCPSQNLQLPWEYEVYPVSWLDMYWGVDFFFWPGKTCSWLILATVAPWGLWGLSCVLTWCMLWSWFRKFVDPLYYFYSFSTISLYFVFSDLQLAQAACVCCNGTKWNPNICFGLFHKNRRIPVKSGQHTSKREVTKISSKQNKGDETLRTFRRWYSSLKF